MSEDVVIYDLYHSNALVARSRLAQKSQFERLGWEQRPDS